MARIPRNYMNTSFFHIMVQGNNKEFIFNSKKDIEIYLGILQEVKEEIPISIISYCIMNNHAHFLFYIDAIEDMIKFMHKTSLRYAKYYNKKYNRVGYVFRGRYKTQEICTLGHFYNCVYYIHQNPVKANICKDAENYPYSSLKNNCFNLETKMEKEIRIQLERQGIWERSKRNSQKNNSISNENEEFLLLEVEENREEICEEVIKEYCQYHKILKENLKQKENRSLLKELVKKLKMEYKISYRIMEKKLKVGRETLRKLV